MSQKGKDQSDSLIVYEKTDNGKEEIQTRKNNLSQKLRTLLIMVDGVKTLEAICNQFPAMQDAMELLAELEQKGLIARKKANVLQPSVLSVDEEQRRAKLAKTFMLNSLKDAVGPMGATLLDTLDKCHTLAELQSHFNDYLYAIESGRGAATADEYRTELSKLFTA